MQDSVLISFAMLNVNWDETRTSYIHNFVPFVAECLKDAPHDVVSVPDLQTCLRRRFGLTLPQPALHGIVTRAMHDGLLDREHGVIRRNDLALARYDLSSKREEVLRQHEALIDKFLTFALEEYGKQLGREDAESLVLNFITERGLPILRAMVRNEPYQDELFDPETAQYLVSTFISRLFERDPAGFTYLETLVKGSMFATAIYLPNPGGAARRIADLTIYLDTPFLLRALGYEGDTGAAAAGELIALLRTLGARLACFDHTLQEVRGVLESCAHALSLPQDRRDGRTLMPVLEYCLQARLGPSEMDRRIEKLDRDFTQIGISVLPTPPYTSATSVDEVELERVLQEVIHYLRDEARLNDLKSITAVYRLRGARVFRQIEDAKAIFVTPNPRLVAASRQFWQERPNGDLVPICSLDYELATVAWLKRPVDAPDLPRKQILADCYAATFPSNALWRRYLDEIDRLKRDNTITEEDYTVLRYSVDSRRALMHQTLGAEEAFTIGTIDEVLRRAHANQQAELLAQLRDATDVANSERLAREAAEAQREESQSAAAEARQMAEQKVAAAHEAYATHIENLAGRIAHGMSQALFVLLTLSVGAAVLVSLPPPFPSLVEHASRWITLGVGLLLLVLAGMTIAHLSIGTSVRSFARSVESRVARTTARFLLKHMSPRDEV
jgi:hypothetical protein